ncbi:MAG TPA: Crp/Fnr family transcriptional regulator [Candidatus Saccharimonadales bacterium]|nr:Crp/Fnr family transcriptional regulator [Candidatus Saccharimonadales bacterium]
MSVIKDFFARYPTKTFAKGEVLIQAESEPPGIFYIREGRISQYDIASSGRTIVVNVFTPAAFFPMSWAINRTPNHYFFEAMTEVITYQAPAEDVVAFLRDNQDVLFDLLSRVYRGTDGLLRRIAHLMGGDSRTRLQFELLNAAYRFGETRPDGMVFVPLKESDLAQSSGLVRETVNRTIHRLKVAGLITVTHQGFILRDLAELERTLGDEL